MKLQTSGIRWIEGSLDPSDTFVTYLRPLVNGTPGQVGYLNWVSPASRIGKASV